MKDRVKSFLVFTTPGYRILGFGIIPLLGLVIGHLVVVLLEVPGYLATVFLLIPAEIMLDFMMFGGICAKDVSHLEYLKGSLRGIGVIKNALVGGMVRTLLVLGVVLVGNQISFKILFPMRQMETGVGLNGIKLYLSAYVVILATVMVGRFFDSININYMLAMVAEAAEIMVASAMEEIFSRSLPAYRVMVMILLSLFAVGLSVISVKIVLKTVKESYYDKTVADGD